jgi:iron complex transport system substrate-binding protein
MRIASLQPSVTATLKGLGALSSLVACTGHCRDLYPEVMQYSPAIIEDAWSAKAAEILAAKPELVIAASPYRAESLAEILKSGVRVLALAPHSLNDIYTDIRTLAALVDRTSAGEHIVHGIMEEISQTQEQTRNFIAQRVYCEEWGKPLIASQLWVAELVRAAGGVVIGEPGMQMTAEAVADADPEVVLVAWCGAGDRVPLDKLAERPGWSKMRAVRDGRIYCVSDQFFNTPAHTLSGGLRIIRWAMYPDRYWRPEGVRALGEPIPAEVVFG